MLTAVTRFRSTLYFYFTLWPWRWDFYLYKVELMRLKYEKSWYWWDDEGDNLRRGSSTYDNSYFAYLFL